MIEISYTNFYILYLYFVINTPVTFISERNESKMKINYDDKPKESLETLLEKYSGIFLILDDVLDSKKSYQFIYQDILDILNL